MSDANEVKDADEGDLARLAGGLRALYGGGVPVPARVDASILARARVRLAGLRRRPVLMRAIAGAAAAAACLLAVVGLWRLERSDLPQTAASTLPAGLLAERVRRGDVTILDALALARRIEAGPAAGHEWDLNGDGVVDRRDVDRVAQAAVALPPEGVRRK